MSKPLVVLVSLAVLVALAVPGRAAQQPVPTKVFLMKDPPAGPQARKIVWKAKVRNTEDLTVVGDPTADGAKLRIIMLPHVGHTCSEPPCEAGGDQCFDMPASGWSPTGSLGFKYVDAALANGPVKTASIKRTPAGTFVLSAVIQGAGIDLYLSEDPIANYATNFSLGGGDEYPSGSGGVTPKPNDSRTFRVRNETGTNTFATACSPSGAFLD